MRVDPSERAGGSEREYVGPFAESAAAREVNVRFGARLRDLRVGKRLSDQELATSMVMPVEHLLELEAGRRSASIVDLEGFAQVFKISISELLQGL